MPKAPKLSGMERLRLTELIQDGERESPPPTSKEIAQTFLEELQKASHRKTLSSNTVGASHRKTLSSSTVDHLRKVVRRPRPQQLEGSDANWQSPAYQSERELRVREGRRLVSRLRHLKTYQTEKGTPEDAWSLFSGTASVTMRSYKGPRIGLEAPWSFGASMQYQIPSDANTILLRIWKMCLAIGRPFTIREARWAAMFKDSPELHDLRLLYRRAWRYAMREGACEALGRPINTADLDMLYDLSDWERNTLRDTEGLEVGQGSFGINADIGSQSTWAERQMPLPQTYDATVRRTVLANWGIELPETLPLSEEADRIYAHWFRFITRHSKWANLSPSERAAIAQRLQVGLMEHQKLEPARDSIDRQMEHRWDWSVWNPLEILKELEGPISEPKEAT